MFMDNVDGDKLGCQRIAPPLHFCGFFWGVIVLGLNVRNGVYDFINVRMVLGKYAKVEQLAFSYVIVQMFGPFSKRRK